MAKLGGSRGCTARCAPECHAGQGLAGNARGARDFYKIIYTRGSLPGAYPEISRRGVRPCESPESHVRQGQVAHGRGVRRRALALGIGRTVPKADRDTRLSRIENLPINQLLKIRGG